MDKLKNYILETASGKFMSGENYLALYKKLEKAKQKGKGSKMASSITDVWEPFELSTVDQLIDMIDAEVIQLNLFIQEVEKLKAKASAAPGKKLSNPASKVG
jgi:hypothetical protein